MTVELASMGYLLKGRFFILEGATGLEGLHFSGYFILGLALCCKLATLYCTELLDLAIFLFILWVDLEYYI